MDPISTFILGRTLPRRLPGRRRSISGLVRCTRLTARSDRRASPRHLLHHPTSLHTTRTSRRYLRRLSGRGTHSRLASRWCSTDLAQSINTRRRIHLHPSLACGVVDHQSMMVQPTRQHTTVRTRLKKRPTVANARRSDRLAHLVTLTTRHRRPDLALQWNRSTCGTRRRFRCHCCRLTRPSRPRRHRRRAKLSIGRHKSPLACRCLSTTAHRTRRSC